VEVAHDVGAIGDTAPDFEAETTEGKSAFTTGWEILGVLSSHPKDFSPLVCKSPSSARWPGFKPEFDKRNMKIIGSSVDPVENHKKWSADIRCLPVSRRTIQ